MVFIEMTEHTTYGIYMKKSLTHRKWENNKVKKEINGKCPQPLQSLALLTKNTASVKKTRPTPARTTKETASGVCP